MPKTSKKSKASKSTGLRKRLDLTNKKVQFFVVIAIVAILGGGWFTYKSFAANAAGFSAHVANGGLECDTNNLGKTCHIISDESKGGSNVALLTNSGGVLRTKNGSLSYFAGHNYRFCIKAKGNGIVQIAGFRSSAYQNIGNSIAVSNSSYKEYCVENSGKYTRSGHLQVYSGHKDTFVSIVSLNVMDLGPRTGTPDNCVNGKNC